MLIRISSLQTPNIAENGFYIDVANSQYLSISIKREVLSESLDGLVEDTKIFWLWQKKEDIIRMKGFILLQ